MPKAHLTHDFVRRVTAEPSGQKTVYYCEEITGFIVEVRPNGSGTYGLRYRDPRGKLRQIKIGGVTDITNAQARKKAQQLRAKVVMGGDPLASKKEVKAIPLCGVLLDMYLEDSKAP